MHHSSSPSRKTPPGTPPVEAFGETHCVIDQSNLFVSATLEDELLLLNAPEGALTRLQEICVRFGFQPEPKRPFSSYSGGEQAILCCTLLMLLVPDGVPVLLVHVLEILFERNWAFLWQAFDEFLPASPLLGAEIGRASCRERV